MPTSPATLHRVVSTAESPSPRLLGDAGNEDRDDAREARIVDNPGLRIPQVEAYEAARQHFAESSAPAIIQLPVGCGKSGLAGLLSVGLSHTRTLIIAPNTTIRQALYDELNGANRSSFWAKTGVFDSPAQAPRVALINGPQATMDDCENADIVIANIQQLLNSSRLWLYRFPPEFFDLVIFDEGHHSAALSWQKVILNIPGGKFVSLTATPFRSDGKNLHGEVIYTYPFSRAMLHGYITQIKSVSAEPSEITFTIRDQLETFDLDEILLMREKAWFRRGVALSDECNWNIASKAVEQLEEHRSATGFAHQIIAAAMSIEHAKSVCSIFEELGVTADVIHSKLPPEEKDAVLTRLRDHSLDAVVQVAMLGEGFDVPCTLG